jgi:hypothetical protein
VLDDVLAGLDLVRRTPHGYMARCPAHHDRTPSLSIREISGRVRLHCFAGCLEDDCWRAIGMERPGAPAPLTLFQRALALARTQFRRRSMSHDDDAWRLIHAARADATRLGDCEETWQLLAEAAALDVTLWNHDAFTP